jgi:hypothetical protein
MVSLPCPCTRRYALQRSIHTWMGGSRRHTLTPPRLKQYDGALVFRGEGGGDHEQHPATTPIQTTPDIRRWKMMKDLIWYSSQQYVRVDHRPLAGGFAKCLCGVPFAPRTTRLAPHLRTQMYARRSTKARGNGTRSALLCMHREKHPHRHPAPPSS